MPSISYGIGAYQRNEGDFPPLTLVNMFVEKSPASENQIALISRRGLTSNSTVGSGPIYGLYTQENLGTSGGVFVLSGSTVYHNGASLGTIDGTVGNPASWAGYIPEVLITRGASLYSYRAGAMAAVSFPDSADVTAITYHDGLFLAIKENTHQVYFSDVNDGRTWDALNFFSAESKPDRLLDLAVLNDTLYLFGWETIEPWINTGDAELPYQRIEQRIYSKGLFATGMVAELDNTLYFVGSDLVVYRLSGDGPERISTHAIEEQIQTQNPTTCYTFEFQGHAFFVVWNDSYAYAYDAATGEWCVLESDSAGFAPRCAAKSDTGSRFALFGDKTDGTIWMFAGDDPDAGWEDDGGSLERKFTAYVQLDQPTVIDNLRVWLNTGTASTACTLQMRYSRDAGRTFSPYESVTIADTFGSSVTKRTLCEWRRLGMFDFPGAMFEFLCDDSTPLRISAVKINEPGGGRSR